MLAANIPDACAQQTARDFINLGNRKLQRLDFRGAEADYTEALKLDARNHVAFYDRGLARQRLQDWDGAAADFTKAIETNPNYVVAYLQRAEVKDFRRDFDSALSDIDQAIKIAPRHAPAYLARAGVRQSKEDLDGAFADCNHAIELDPKLLSAYFERGSLKQNKNDLNGAIEDYNRILSYDKTNTAAFSNLAHIKREQGDMEGALSNYTRIIEITPTEAYPHYHRGDILLRIGDLAHAIDEFGRAIELGRKAPGLPNSFAYLGHGLALQEHGDTNAAMEALNDYVKFPATNSWELSTRAKFRQLLGDWSGAQADYDASIRVASTNELQSVRSDRGNGRLAAGDFDGALGDFNKCLDLELKNKGWIASFVWLAQALKGDRKAADKALAEYLAKKAGKPRDEFGETFARYFLDRASQDELAKMLDTGAIYRRIFRRSSFWCLTGMKQLADGNRAEAIARFNKCLAIAELGSDYYFLAKLELARLTK